MASIRDLFTFYLKAEHLRGQSVVVHIESCNVEQVYTPRNKRTEPKLLIRFHGKKLALCANKTQAATIEQIAKTDDYEKWIGHAIMLTPTTIERADTTITITAPPKLVNSPAPTTANTAPQAADIAAEEEEEGEEDLFTEDLDDLKYE